MRAVIASSDINWIARWRSVLASDHRVAVVKQWHEVLQLHAAVPQFCVLDLQLLPPQFVPHDLVWLFAGCPVCLVHPSFSIDEELRWLASGVRACCTPGLEDERLAMIVDVTAKGGIWVSTQSLPALLKGLQHFTAHPSSALASSSQLTVLTPQERKIAQLVGQGQSNKLIARALNISDHTVKAHLSAIFSKLHLTDRVHLALLVTQEPSGRETE